MDGNQSSLLSRRRFIVTGVTAAGGFIIGISALPHLANATMRVKEWEGDVVFLHEVGPGAADRSYGIQVAKLAGLPPAVIERARDVLAILESDGRHDRAHKLIDDLPLFSAAPKPAPAQKESAVEAELKKINPDDLSPKEALELLYRLRGLGTKD